MTLEERIGRTVDRLGAWGGGRARGRQRPGLMAEAYGDLLPVTYAPVAITDWEPANPRKAVSMRRVEEQAKPRRVTVSTQSLEPPSAEQPDGHVDVVDRDEQLTYTVAQMCARLQVSRAYSFDKWKTGEWPIVID